MLDDVNMKSIINFEIDWGEIKSKKRESLSLMFDNMNSLML